MKRPLLLFAAHLLAVVASVAGEFRPAAGAVLQPDGFRHYVESFNRLDRETVTNHIPNAGGLGLDGEECSLVRVPR